MQFRHPDTVHVATTDGLAAVVGPEWRELPPILHVAALAAGCECDQTQFRAEAPAKPAPTIVTDHDTVIREALELMLARKGDSDFEGDFTADNTPNAKSVGKLCGFNVSKEAVMNVFVAMQNEAAE